MDGFILFLGIIFIFMGFGIPIIVDCGLGAIGLFLFGLVGLYLVFTQILTCFGEKGKRIQAALDARISAVFSAIFGASEFDTPVYYAISIGRSLLIGIFFSLFTVILGFSTFSILRSGYIWDGVKMGLLFAATVYPGPITLFKAIRELSARVKKYLEDAKEN